MVSNIYNESEKNKSENSIQAPSILFVNPIKKKIHFLTDSDLNSRQLEDDRGLILED